MIINYLVRNKRFEFFKSKYSNLRKSDNEDLSIENTRYLNSKPKLAKNTNQEEQAEPLTTFDPNMPILEATKPFIDKEVILRSLRHEVTLDKVGGNKDEKQNLAPLKQNNLSGFNYDNRRMTK